MHKFQYLADALKDPKNQYCAMARYYNEEVRIGDCRVFNIRSPFFRHKSTGCQLKSE